MLVKAERVDLLVLSNCCIIRRHDQVEEAVPVHMRNSIGSYHQQQLVSTLGIKMMALTSKKKLIHGGAQFRDPARPT